eukprot:COSAG05_NODE_120_length_17734_cov_79.637823_11_plen_122_part_00
MVANGLPGFIASITAATYLSNPTVLVVMHIKSDEEWLEAGEIKTEDIRKCEQHIEAETGFKMTLVIKPFEVKQRIPDAYISRDTVDAGQFILKTLGADLVQDTIRTDVKPRLFHKHGRKSA